MAAPERTPRSVFISHGAPDLLEHPELPAHRFLSELGRMIGTPRAIVVVSAHWSTAVPMLEVSPQPQTIHDFGGFSPALQRFEYRAPGAPEVALELARALTSAGFEVGTAERGLDHGAWVPLAIAFPKAGVPIVQLSLQASRDARHHYELGRAMRSSAADVLILASGGATHSLRELGHPEECPAAWSKAFDDWLVDKIEAGDVEALLGWNERAPHALRSHPTSEHLLPLFVALGASRDGRGRALHRSTTYGSLAMTAFAFEASDGVELG